MIQANPNAPGCQAASSNPANETTDQNNILVDKFISISGQNVDDVTDLEAAVVYVVNHLPQFTVGEKELYSFVLPFLYNSGSSSDYFVDAIYFDLKKGKGTYGTGGIQLTVNDIRKGLRSQMQLSSIDLGDLGSAAIQDYINGSGPYSERIFKCIISGTAHVYLYTGFALAIGDGAATVTAADFIDLSSQGAIPLTYNTVIHPIDLRDVDTTQTELKIIYDAVTSRGPFTALANQQMIFQTRLLENGDMVTRNYRLLNNVTKVGTGVSIVGAQLKFMCDGASKTIAITDSNLVDLDYIGATPVAAAFNVGKPDGAGGYGPWDMGVYRFIRAEDTDGVKFYSWVGLETLYGGDELGSNPEIHEAVDADFFNLTDQPSIPSTQNFLFYEDIAAMLAGQPYQGLQTLLEVADASADTSLTFAPGVTDKQAYYRFLGTAAPGLGAYILVSAPNAGGGKALYTADTGTEITLYQHGNFCNSYVANLEDTAFTFALTNEASPQGESATVLIKTDSGASGFPTVTDAEYVEGAPFAVDGYFDLYAWHNGATVAYTFLSRSAPPPWVIIIPDVLGDSSVADWCFFGGATTGGYGTLSVPNGSYDK